MSLFSRIFFPVLFVVLTGCASTPNEVEWPVDLPEQQQFSDYYAQSELNHPLQTESNYLTWVRRFFYGTPLQPKGWLEMSQELEEHVGDDQTDYLRTLMHDLGVKIAKEWAQDNKVRKVDTKNMIVWGSVLREAIVADDVITIVESIDADVEQMLVGQLDRKDINSDRYFKMEYDEFF